MILDTSWYRGSWWDFAEDAFVVYDNRWYIDDFNEGGTLVYYDTQSDSWVPVPGDGPFFNGNGEFLGFDYMWETPGGEIIAWTGLKVGKWNKSRKIFVHRGKVKTRKQVESLIEYIN